MTSTNDLLNERGKTHGDWHEQAEKAVEIKRTFEATSSLSVVQYEALQMIAVKISRILTGNPNCVDHWKGIAGYATLIVNELTEHEPHTASEVGAALKGKVRCVIAPNGLDLTVGTVYDIAKGHADPNWILVYNDLNKVGSYKADYFVQA